MKSISFYKTNRSGNKLHIETELCIVNIKINLHDPDGNEVTRVEILPDEGIVFGGCCNNVLTKQSRRDNL